MAWVQALWARGLLVSLCAVGMLSLSGCGGLKLVPVAGKVTLNGQPLSTGRVLFSPDSSKGNEAPVGCSGRLDSQGRFELRTAGTTGGEKGRGAPPGWYKVTLMDVTGKSDLEDKVDPKFFDASTTPWSVEVVANPAPDRYHFEVTP